MFDLDGLLLDSESAWDGGRRALARTLAHRMEAGWRAFEVDVVDAGAQSTDVA